MTHVIAHRGASAVAPENTVAAFDAAVAAGADGVELDVRRTADGQAAVHHDAALADGRLIHLLAAEELPDAVPSLEAALVACRPLEVNVEIKNAAVDPDFDPTHALADQVVEVVGRAGIDHQVIVSSFAMGAIDRVRMLAPAMRTAWLVHHGEAAALVERTVSGGHVGIHPMWPMVDATFVEQAHAAGLFVNVWTVDDPDEVRRLAALGVDGIVTNDPAAALAALGR